MRLVALKSLVVVALGALTASAQAAHEQDFWKWFANNEAELFSFEKSREATFDRLGFAMARVHPDLTFEFGPVINGKREFVISAGGIKSAFPAVEALYASAPALHRWKWTKFRQRSAEIHDIEFGGKLIRSKDVSFLLSQDGWKIGITLFLDGYTEQDERYDHIGYLFLDQSLGEHDVETKVGFIAIQSRKSTAFSQSSPISELPSHFEKFWAQKAR